MDLNDREQELLRDLRSIQRQLRKETLTTFGRMNPFIEDLADWKERGRAWTKDDRDVTIYDSTTVVGDVQIGQGTWVGPFCSLDGTGGLTIGEHCSISLGCQLLSHDTVKWALSGGKAPYEYAPTTIGAFCFLGTLAVITKGVHVGERCVVAAGAVVTENVLDQTIVAGTPAKPIGRVDLGEDGSVELHYEL